MNRLASVVGVCVLAALACDGDGGPSDPDASGLRISGLWMQSSEAVSGFRCPEVNLWDPFASERRLAQSGELLSLIQDGEQIADGSVNLETGEFVLSGTIEGGGVTVTFTQRGQFTSETSYTAETSIRIRAQFITCDMRTIDSGTQ